MKEKAGQAELLYIVELYFFSLIDIKL